jgi:cytochrome c biogenesis protein CcdA
MKRAMTLLFALLFITTFVAAAEINVYEFSQLGCAACQALDASGKMEEVSQMENVTLTKYLLNEGEGQDLFWEIQAKLEFEPVTPTVVIECNGTYNYLATPKEIINNIDRYIENCEEDLSGNGDGPKRSLTLGAIIVAGIIDSINPCAFGVLIFLMISLLNLGSRKRALKYGLIYSAVIFVTYFLAGLGIFRLLQEMASIRNIIYITVGIIVLILGLIEFSDFLKARKGKEATLKISSKIKPFIESRSKKGTILGIMALGVIVALFELPCTGGIYLGIISLLLETSTLGVIYLIIYNLIFVLPLIIITLLVYKGMSPRILQKWTGSEKAWMRLAASIAMILIAIWLISIGI